MTKRSHPLGEHGVLTKKPGTKKEKFYTVPRCKVCDQLLLLEWSKDKKVRQHKSDQECLEALTITYTLMQQAMACYVKGMQRLAQRNAKKRINFKWWENA